EALQPETLRIIPSCIPPHRDAPTSTPTQRLDMLHLAFDGVGGIDIDTREIERQGRSYAVDTLSSIREDIGSELPLTMVIGCDQFSVLDEWHDWHRLFELAHIAVMQRPGYETRQMHADVADNVEGRYVESAGCLRGSPAGSVCRLTLTQLDISSTAIRRMIAEGRSPKYLLPEQVIEYIHEHGMYLDSDNHGER
ncbi:MAG TPA: nicotinate-nucleotide adenylyltransferase, partial [Pseudomonadales bacterium]|nr:nicotinate-nucleotide adenylyltransferase [Pseudomonadales bacterium]